MDKFAALSAFVRVVEAEGFAAAARETGQSRSAINRMVIELEHALGAQLLHRSTRSLSPTSTGAAFHVRALRILELLEDAEREARGEASSAVGLLRVSAPSTFGACHMGPAVAEFMARHPGLRVRLDLSDRIVDLVEEGFDLAVRIGVPQEDANLVDFRICEAERVLCAAPNIAEALGATAKPEALNGVPGLIYTGAGVGAAPFWRLNGPSGQVRVRPSPRLESNNGEALRDAAVQGLGVALLPTFIVGPLLADGRLSVVLPTWRPSSLTLAVVYPPSRRLAAKVRLFTDFVIARFGDLPPWDVS